MKKVISIITMAVIILAVAVTTVKAATTKEELKEYMLSSKTIAGSEFTLSEANKVKVERVLNQVEITDEQASQIKSKIDEGIAYMNKAGVSDPTKLSKSQKQEILAIAQEAAAIANLTITYDSTSESISVYKDGKLLESTTIGTSSTKLVQTGSTNYVYVIVPVIVAIAGAAIIILNKKASKINA